MSTTNSDKSDHPNAKKTMLSNPERLPRRERQDQRAATIRVIDDLDFAQFADEANMEAVEVRTPRDEDEEMSVELPPPTEEEKKTPAIAETDQDRLSHASRNSQTSMTPTIIEEMRAAVKDETAKQAAM